MKKNNLLEQDTIGLTEKKEWFFVKKGKWGLTELIEH